MPIKRASNKDKAKCDTIFSLIVRSKGECENCHVSCECPEFPKSHNKLCKLTCSHIVGRKYSATRTLEANAQCLCYSCHRRFEDWPREFSKWITDTIGSDAYDELSRLAQQVTKMDWSSELERLKEIARSKAII